MIELRDFTLGDAGAVDAWIADIGEASAASWLADAAAESDRDPRDRFTQAVILNGEVVGAVMLNIDSAADARAEVGFVIAPSARRSKIASGAVELLCSRAFEQLDLHRLWGVCDPSNVGAVGVFGCTGFLLEGRLVDDRRHGDAWHDSLIFGRVSSG